MDRKLTAILCADVHGYSRLMGENEEATLRSLSASRKIIDGLIEQHRGRFVGSAGDSVIAEFASVVNAVQCAVEVQAALGIENASRPPECRMEFRIGVNLGDVMVEGEQIYGDGVNVAARLESLAEPGGICISGTVHDQVRDKLALSYQDRGEQSVKNIARPVRVWRVLLDGTPALRRQRRRIPRRYWRGGVLSLTGLAIAIATVVLVQNLSFKSLRTSASIPPQEKPALPLPSIPSIAVLPFVNLSGDPGQDYFSDGISVQLINQLSHLPGLFVIARNSSFVYKGRAVKEHEVGSELGVKYVLEGSVHKAANRIRIAVELVDASSGTEMWTQRYDRQLKDIFAVQDEIVGKVVTTLNLIFKVEKKLILPGAWQPTDSPEAFDDFLRSLEYQWRLTKDDNARARQWAEKAIKLDPRFAEAYVLLGWTYCLAVFWRWSENPEADVERSFELAQKALALDDFGSNTDARALLCDIYSIQRRFDQAIAEGEREIAVNPTDLQAYEGLSIALTVSGRPEDAIRVAEKATRLDPHRPDWWAYFVGSPLVLMRRYQEAMPLLKRNLAVYPNNVWAHITLVMAYVELGRDNEARAEAAEVMRISPHFTLPPPGKGLNKDEAWNRRFDSDLRKAGFK